MLQFLKNSLLICFSVVLSAAFAEAMVRYLDGYDMFAMPLSVPSGSETVSAPALDQVPRAAGVERDWFFAEPPAMPNRKSVPDDWMRRYRAIENDAAASMDYRPSDLFKVWNSASIGDPCQHRRLRHASGRVLVYDPPDSGNAPPYRFLPDVTIPSGLVTNQIGWRGAPIENPRGDKTIRIVFVGSSTTVDSHHLPFSWPELAGHWLNLWAREKKLGVRFEVLNAARESITSTDIAAIVRTEVLPLRPDLVVYYEGGNQFRPSSIVADVPKGSAVRPQPAKAAPEWLRAGARYSAVIARVQAALGAATSEHDGHEWPKPDYRVVWPEGLDEADPDLAYPRLPVSLNTIQRDLDRIRGDLAEVGSDFAMGSFMWMVKDGLVLDPIRHRYILEQLNIGNYPFHYRDLERLAKFQNRLFAKYAATHGIAFVDIAGVSPFDPNLFTDAVHTNYAGTRLRAWVAFNLLLPTVEKHLADGSWPRPWPAGAPTALPTFTPREIAVSCK